MFFKKKNQATAKEIEIFTLIGLSKPAAKGIAGKIANICWLSGCNADHRKNVFTAIGQCIVRGAVGEEQLRQIMDNCPPLYIKLKGVYRYNDRAIMRHAANKRLKAKKFVDAIMLVC